MKGYFISATDTGAGKTFVTAGLLRSLSAMGCKTLGFKPVASGCQSTPEGLQNEDALELIKAASVTLDYQMVNPYAFAPAIAPHIAAQLAGVTIDLQAIASTIHHQQHKADYVLVEGVGGWQVPLNEQESIADLASLLDFPVILVVNMRLGCLNHALLTAQAIKQTGLTMAGWIANNTEPHNNMPYMGENIDSLKARLAAPLLGVLPNLADQQHFADFIDLAKCT